MLELNNITKTYKIGKRSVHALSNLSIKIEKGEFVAIVGSSGSGKSTLLMILGGYYLPEKKLFDHHQTDYQGPLSSAGMVWLYLMDQKIIEEDLFFRLRKDLIKSVDDFDNGREPLDKDLCTFSHIISNFCPIHYDCSHEEENQAFFAALDFAVGHIQRWIDRYRYVRSCRSIVEERMKEDKQCLFFEEGIPWVDSYFELDGEKHPAEFIIMPAGPHWKLRGIPPSTHERMKVKHPLPESWAGLLAKDLKKVTGIDGAIFCHKGLFISVWETREDAKKALDLVLKKA